MAKPDEASRAESTARALAQDLFSLEINTILKPQITGGQMPLVRFALCQVARAYASKMVEFGVVTPGELDADEGGIPGGFDTFDALRERARDAQNLAGQPETDEERARFYMLSRIRGNCDRIKQIFELRKKEVADRIAGQAEPDPKDWDNPYTKRQLVAGLRDGTIPDMRLDREDYSRLRKIWEIGTEEIAMQTVVKLDGDVVSRIQPRFADKDFEMLHKIHAGSVDVSLRYWNGLVEILVSFIGAVFKYLFVRGSAVAKLIRRQ